MRSAVKTVSTSMMRRFTTPTAWNYLAHRYRWDEVIWPTATSQVQSYSGPRGRGSPDPAEAGLLVWRRFFVTQRLCHGPEGRAVFQDLDYCAALEQLQG